MVLLFSGMSSVRSGERSKSAVCSRGLASSTLDHTSRALLHRVSPPQLQNLHVPVRVQVHGVGKLLGFRVSRLCFFWPILRGRKAGVI